MRTVARLVHPRQRVLQPFLVVAIAEVFARVRAAAFLAIRGRVHRDERLAQQVVEFERLDQIGIPDQRAVGNLHIR